VTEIPKDGVDAQSFPQADFQKITELVATEFQIQEAFVNQGTSTYYLVWPQETKQAFLRLLMHLKEMKLIAFLRKEKDRIVLTVVPEAPVKPSNPRTNLILLLATVATTFITGYIGFPETGISPVVIGIVFSVAILLVLGIHEMGHKLTANKRKIDATSPYFIPGHHRLELWVP
jgi:hypothetical protein